MKIKILSYCTIVLAGIGLLFHCQEKNPDPTVNPASTIGCDGDINGTNCQFFAVPKDCTLMYSAGTEIIAREGIEISGHILINPDQPGDFTLTSLSGDIILSGTIVYDTTFNPNTGGRIAAGEDGQKGKSIVINAENGNVIVKSTHTIVAFDGWPATDKLLKSTLFAGTDSGYVAGGNGGDGGDILLNAINGDITLPAASEIPNGHTLFRPGIGGKGGSVVLDSYEFVVNEGVTSLFVKGGNGGRSGKIVLAYQQIIGGWTIHDLENREFFFIDAGRGGVGGNAYWFPYRPISQKTNIENLYFEGGKGGDGIIQGGSGGFAACNLYNRVINKVGSKITDVFVTGGDGGNVIAVDLSMHKVFAGDGGEFLARGARGWDGGKEEDSDIFHKSGASGGSVTVKGGKGGNVERSVRAYRAEAGDGAMTDLAREVFVDEIIQIFDVQSGYYDDLFYGSVAGNGGTGANTCLTDNRGPGGDGGSVGSYFIYGGDGGNIETSSTIISHQGDGGDIWSYGAGQNGDGGDGQPGGTGASDEANGKVVPGNGKEQGEISGIKYVPEDGKDGKICQESCAPGGIVTGYYESGIKFGDFWLITTVESVSRNGTNGGSYWVSVVATRTNPDGTTTTYEWNEGDNPAAIPASNQELLGPFSPRCTQNGAIYMPGTDDQIIRQDENSYLIMGSTGCTGWDDKTCICNDGMPDCE
jgi:hypothetical protein